MIKLKDILSEIPIDTYSTIGNFEKGSSYTNPVDRKLITSPVAIQKVKDFFKNTSESFDFYFVNTKEARKHTEVGEVDEDFIYNKLGIKPEQLKDGKINYNNITVFFTNNKGAERYPMTAWIMAHRFGHVVRKSKGYETNYAWAEYSKWIDRSFIELLQAYGYNVNNATAYDGWNTGSNKRREFQLAKRNMAETLGTFKSARDKNLREEFEFDYEWFALYLKTGKTPLNPLPEVITLGHGAFGRTNNYRLKDRESAEHTWTEMTRDGYYYMDGVLSSAEGNIYVM